MATHADQLRMLLEMGHDLITCHDPEALLHLAIRHAMRFSGHDGGSVLLWRPADNTLEVRASAGFDAAPMGTLITDLQRSVAGRVLTERRLLQLEGRAEELGTEWRDYTKPIAWSLCLPLLVSDQEAIGVLALKSSTPVRRLTSGDTNTLQLLATQLAVAIQNAQLYAEREVLLRQIAEREQQQQALIQRLFSAHEEERRRVAYELHDGLAQQAASAHQHLQGFAGRFRPRRPQARQDLQRALDLAQQTVRETRRVIAGLRPTALDDFGLGVALRLEVEALRASGWEIAFEDTTADARFSPTVETILFRVAQEALHNIRKHAATTVARLSLRHDGATLRLMVQDWGCGFDTSVPVERARPGERMGLLGMRERVALVGGQCQITSRIGAGTTVVIEVPLA
jgi:signal transduction histidine kinase